MINPAGYTQIYDGKPWTVNSGDKTLLSCCDCGLVHEVTLTIVRNRIKVKYAAADSETKQNRALDKTLVCKRKG